MKHIPLENPSICSKFTLACHRVPSAPNKQEPARSASPFNLSTSGYLGFHAAAASHRRRLRLPPPPPIHTAAPPRTPTTSSATYRLDKCLGFHAAAVATHLPPLLPPIPPTPSSAGYTRLPPRPATPAERRRRPARLAVISFDRDAARPDWPTGR